MDDAWHAHPAGGGTAPIPSGDATWLSIAFETRHLNQGYPFRLSIWGNLLEINCSDEQP